jgi:oligoribonuclease NrnB/cAMP/cGMP phosphodiesterase (DHH superfamily)
MKTICIYHSRDLDGWMSSAIVKLAFDKLDFLGWDYGNEIPDLKKYDQIVMVDISLPKEIMQTIAPKLIWIDHHISAIKDSDIGLYNLVTGLRNDKFAACELTWQYLFPNTVMPELVRLLGRYDCFGHKGTEEELKVLEFQYGARQAIGNIQEAFETLMIARGRGDWSFDADLCDDIHLQGKAIYKYLCTEAKQTYSKKFTVMFDTYKFAMVNQERFNPINFGINYHKDGYDGFACSWYQKGKWIYSLYNDNGLVDCSDICKSRGGGGHKGAAGFQSDKFLTE